MLKTDMKISAKGLLKDISEDGTVTLIDKNDEDMFNIIEVLNSLKGEDITLSFGKTEKGI